MSVPTLRLASSGVPKNKGKSDAGNACTASLCMSKIWPNRVFSYPVTHSFIKFHSLVEARFAVTMFGGAAEDGAGQVWTPGASASGPWGPRGPRCEVRYANAECRLIIDYYSKYQTKYQIIRLSISKISISHMTGHDNMAIAGRAQTPALCFEDVFTAKAN